MGSIAPTLLLPQPLPPPPPPPFPRVERESSKRRRRTLDTESQAHVVIVDRWGVVDQPVRTHVVHRPVPGHGHVSTQRTPGSPLPCTPLA